MKQYVITIFKPVLVSFFILLTFSTVHGCDLNADNKGANKSMQTYNIGRFSIAIPIEMELKLRSSKLRNVAIKEILWPINIPSEQARIAEWDRFMAEIKRIEPPEGKDKVIIKTHDFLEVGKWVKGVFNYYDHFRVRTAQWNLLMDTGPVGVWLTGNPSIVEKENVSHKMINNIENIAKNYLSQETLKQNMLQAGNRYYLQHGAINMPYLEQEESIARFEGHPFHLKLLIEMEMDFNHEIETMGLIKKTRGMLAAALITPGGSISKIRLDKRNVAGMPGEEAVLKVREGKETNLVFTWEFNGKDDSGEYPTTRINMESPDGNLDEKLKIWDAILDSMKPMLVQEK
ncbi:MAG: T6SS immunity protein Tli4 family protein [Desulfobulbus sp.]|nr:T6SS immunity protein Tli4 family protein [Desulfobulbus sp.]